MAAEQIARNLAFVNWTVLAGLAIGSVASVALLWLRSEATGGFLGFTSLCAAVFGALALLSDLGLPGGHGRRRARGGADPAPPTPGFEPDPGGRPVLWRRPAGVAR